MNAEERAGLRELGRAQREERERLHRKILRLLGRKTILEAWDGDHDGDTDDDGNPLTLGDVAERVGVHRQTVKNVLYAERRRLRLLAIEEARPKPPPASSLLAALLVGSLFDPNLQQITVPPWR